ncbi:MAG TPA: site-specific integrase [Blastocatellia bacterium]|nr:site-specific integrase [Blastocatellia bacterium]
MARRRSYQKGNVQWHNRQWTVRYWELDHQTGQWSLKRAKLEGCYDKNNKKAALKAAGPFMERINEQNNNPRKQTKGETFRGFVEGLWKSYQENQQLQPSTIYSYQSMIKTHLMPAFGDRRLSDITPADMTVFFDGLRGKASPKYASNLYALLNTMFEVAHQYEVIESKPLKSKLHKPKYEAEEKPVLSVEVLRAIIDQVPQEYKVLFVLLATTGLRLGECLGLCWLNFDFTTRELSITHSLWRGTLKPPKTKASERVLRLPVVLSDLLRQERMKSAFTRPHDFIFCRADGSPFDPDHLRNVVLYPAMDALGIERSDREFGFHIFRHTAGSVAYAKTRNLKGVQKALGHSRESTTSDIYVHVDTEAVGDMIEVVAAELLNNCDLLVTWSSEKAS